MFAVSSRATERGIVARQAMRQAMRIEEERAARLQAQIDALRAFELEKIEIERRRASARERAEAYAAELRAAGVRYRPTLRSIEAKACRVFNLPLSRLRGESRNRHVVLARQFVMYWAARTTALSMAQIGKLMGGRDHTTILHGIKTYPKKRERMGRHVRSIQHRCTS
jgi:chromosomal replication initiation ATPase DnaA